GLVFPRGIYRGLIAVLDKRAFLTRKFRFTTINGVDYAKFELFDSHRMSIKTLTIYEQEAVSGGILFVPFIIANAPAFIAGLSATASFVGRAAVVATTAYAAGVVHRGLKEYTYLALFL
ncbi:MAG: hypothetical protein ACSHWT_14660, partial [Glaciecola sp.]